MLTMKMRTKSVFLSLLFGLLLVSFSACTSDPEIVQQTEPVGPAEAQPINPVTVQEATPSDLAPEEEAISVFECTETNPHPMGQSIAETFDVSYEQVMTWFCDDYTFDDILIALETGQATDIPAAVLLEMRMEKTWSEIWVEIGLTED
jgi:hypothetical protein